MKILFSVPLILFLCSCSVHHENSFIRSSVENITISPSQSLYIKADFQQDVNFQGLYDYDSVDLKSGNMTYAADSGAMFLASIFAHAVTADAMKNSAMSEAQVQANVVLNPYRKHLQQFEIEELVSSILKSVNENYDFHVSRYTDDKALSGLVVKSVPVFYMTQDQRELILSHAMYVYRLNEPEVLLHKNIIEITSERTSNNNHLNYWIDQNKLPVISSELYARSVELFINDMLGVYDKSINGRQQTFRYKQGGVKKYERGTLVKNECGNTTMRTLRGWIKSFPNNAAVKAENRCTKKSYVDSNSQLGFSDI